MDMYQEKNRDALVKGIRALPSYAPQEGLWDSIESKLEGQARFVLAVQELPQYTPPASVWQQLEADLEQKATPSRPIRRLWGKAYRWTAAAAVAGILVLCARLFISTDQPARTSFYYTEETLTAPSVENDWNAEQSSFTLVLQQVDRSTVADPNTVQRLKLEYYELTDAREEVEQMMQRYGEDVDLLQEIARIERERTKVIKELATWI